jgi:Reverse transcriptase (RNA-dependent DNA polymerase)
VTSDISVMRAEWGVVVSRSFNRTGVIEAYFFETKSYGFRFKFERLAVPVYAMDILRNLALPSDPIVHEPTPDLPDAGLPDAGPIAADVAAPGLTDAAVPELISDEEADVDTAPVDPGHMDTILQAMSAQISYRDALLSSPDRAVPAMETEVQMLFGTKNLGRPIRIGDIPSSDRKFILQSLDGYKEKFSNVDGTFIKSKARIFANGSRQLPEFTAESSSPVARIESIYALIGIAAFKGWEVMRFDVVCGYPNTPRPPEVRYRYLRLNPQVSAIVIKLFPDYAAYANTNGSLIIDLDHLLYGMKESGFYFYLLMVDMLNGVTFVANDVDPCVFHLYHTDGWEAHNAMTVDDCLIAYSAPAGRKAMMDMFTGKFGAKGFTYVEGNDIDILGLLLQFDRVNRRVLVSQRKFVADLLIKAGVTKFAKTPCSADLFHVPQDSPLCSDPDLYRSLNQSLAYAAGRTYPECLPASAMRATRHPVATELDMKELKRTISYLGHDLDHCLVIHPGSLSLVCSADASYGVHHDGKSHSGVCVGFKGCNSIDDSYFIFSSRKQSIVTTSSCEAELVCANKGASYLVWAAQLFEGFRLSPAASNIYRNADSTPYAHEVIEMPVLHQDNNSTIHLIAKGRGNFDNTKHIRVRYYFIRDLVLNGELLVQWKSTVDMVADLLSKGAAFGVFNYLLPKLIGKR